MCQSFCTYLTLKLFLCLQKLRANLWFASRRRQNYWPKAAKLRAKLRFASLTKLCFVRRLHEVFVSTASFV
ncbi:hypothetical protein EON73_03500 [bacterium]|nr:MAG: hypothetical protein EON73_03500 [bacterium]